MKQKDLLILLTPMFIVTILWVIFNIYHNHVTSTITDPLTVQIIPIDGNFNKASIESIKNRKRTEPLFVAPVNDDEEISPIPTPSVIPDEEETASPSATNLDEDSSGN